jgi:anti-sigma regulatory factor (Ser/Thr protein kinase)
MLMHVLLDVRLPPGSEAAGMARRALEDLLPSHLDGALSTLQLGVSELVSNASRHGDLQPTDEIGLVVREMGDRLRVEVKDPGHGHDAAVAGWSRIPEIFPGGDPPSADHYGLFVVREISDGAGVVWDDGTVAWFEVARSSL